MPALVVGGVTIPVAISSPAWSRSDAVDRGRMFDGTFFASESGGATRDWTFSTTPVTQADADTYIAALSSPAAKLCSGDIIQIPTMCSPELPSGKPTRAASSNRVVLDFMLHEIQPSKVLLRYAPGDLITGEAFLRSTTATQYSSAGVVTSAAINAKRDAHWLGGIRYRLDEKSSTNLVIQAENFSLTWTLSGTPTRTAAFVTAAGVTMDLIGDDSAAAVEGYEQVIGFTGDGLKTMSWFVNGSGSTVSSVFRLRDNTAAANRLFATLTWSGGLPVLAMTAGIYLGYDVLAGGCFRLKFQTSSVTAANSNQFSIFPATTAAFAVADTGNLCVGGVQAENTPLPSSYIPTTTATVIRASDSDSFSITFSPGEATFYTKFVELGTVGQTNARVWEISNAAEDRARLYVYAPSGTYVATYGATAGDVASGLLTAPAYGDIVELLVHLHGDGSIQITQSINGGTATTGTLSGPSVLAAAWSGNLLWLNSAGTTGGIGFAAYQSFKAVAGTRSLPEMRAA